MAIPNSWTRLRVDGTSTETSCFHQAHSAFNIAANSSFACVAFHSIRLGKVRLRVEHRRVDALRPLPELASIAAELEREIVDLELRLGQSDEKVSATVSGLLATINVAQSLDELSEVREFIQQAAGYELLHQEELHRIYSTMNDKADLIYDRARAVHEEPPRKPGR